MYRIEIYVKKKLYTLTHFLFRSTETSTTVSHLGDAYSFASFHSLQTDVLELLVVHRLRQIMDTESSLGHVHIYVSELGSLHLFELTRALRNTNVRCKLTLFTL